MVKKEQEKSLNVNTDTVSKLFLMLDRINDVLLTTQKMIKQQDDKINNLSKNVDGLKERIMMIDGDINYLEKYLDKKINTFYEKSTQHQKLMEENITKINEILNNANLNISKDKNECVELDNDTKNVSVSYVDNNKNVLKQNEVQGQNKTIINFVLDKENIKSSSLSSWWKKTDPENKNILDFPKEEKGIIIQKFFEKYLDEKILNKLENTYPSNKIKYFILNFIENIKSLNLNKINAHLFFENNHFERLCFQINGFRNKKNVSILFIFYPFEKKLIKNVEIHYEINRMKQNRIFDLYDPYEEKIMLFQEIKKFIEAHAFI